MPLGRDDLLTRLRALEGVRSAVLVGPDGVWGSPDEAGPLAAASEELATYLTSDRVLAELLGAELPTQTLLEFSAKTMLLAQTTDLGGETVCAVLLFVANDLNRVRFGLRRLLPELADARPLRPRP